MIGFFTLCAASMAVSELPPELARKLPRYPQLPVILLGRLACDLRIRGQGQGEFLLMDALRRSRETAGQIGAMAVVVDAKDAGAEDLYLHYGFIRLQAAACPSVSADEDHRPAVYLSLRVTATAASLRQVAISAACQSFDCHGARSSPRRACTYRQAELESVESKHKKYCHLHSVFRMIVSEKALLLQRFRLSLPRQSRMRDSHPTTRSTH